MKSVKIILSILLIAVSLMNTTVNAEEKVKPIKALLVTGGCCHDYKGQTKVITEGLSKRIKIKVDVAKWNPKAKRNAKLEVYTKKDWAKGYDVVIHNECYGGVTDVPYIENIAKAHEKGVGAVMLHCSMHSYRNAKTDAWRKIVGVTSKRHEGKRAFKVELVKKDHPITLNFVDGWLPPNGELYMIEKVWPKAVVLAKAYGKDTKKYHPVVWVNTHGKGRTFGTTIGHHTETMAQPEYLDLLTKGLLWSCKKLGEDGSIPKTYIQKKKDNKKEKAKKQ